MKRKTPSTKKPLLSSQVPVTHEMLYEMEQRLSRKIDSSQSATNGKFLGLSSEFRALKAEFLELRSEFHGLKSDFHRVALLVEEQNARNK